MPSIIDPKYWYKAFTSLSTGTKQSPPKTGPVERAVSELMAYADDGDSHALSNDEKIINDYVSDSEQLIEELGANLEAADTAYEDLADTFKIVLGFLPNVYMIEDDDTQEIRKWANASLKDWEYTYFTNAKKKVIHILIINDEADRALFMLRWR